MNTLTSFRCERYKTIEAYCDNDIAILGEQADHKEEGLSRAMVTWQGGAKRAKARKLNHHMSRCKVCR